MEGLVLYDPETQVSYRFLQRLGGGSFGEVYSASVDHENGSQSDAPAVVLKVFKRGYRDPSEFKRMYMHEFLIAEYFRSVDEKVCDNYAVCAIRQFAFAGFAYIVYPYSAAKSLWQFLSEDFYQVWDDPTKREHYWLVGLDICEQLLGALAHVHATGVFHADLSINNVVVSVESGHPRLRLIDFGWSCSEKTEAFLAEHGYDVGLLSCKNSPPFRNVRESEKIERVAVNDDIESAARTLIWVFDTRPISVLKEDSKGDQYAVFDIQATERMPITDASLSDGYAGHGDFVRLLREMTGPVQKRRSAISYSLAFRSIKRRLKRV